MSPPPSPPSRRDLLLAIAAFPLAGACGDEPKPGPAGGESPTQVPSQAPSARPGDPPTNLTPTPACGTPTTPSTEGPYFKPSSPERRSLLDGTTGTPMLVSGTVRTLSATGACAPVAGALVELWHADPTGAYDNEGFRMRGHVFTDADGRYEFETLTPGLYPGRTRHFHVKVAPSGGNVLTTQLYFPDEPANTTDGIFSSSLIMKLEEAAGVTRATFDFVLQ